MGDIVEQVDAKLDAFRRDTDIWPPGRSMPAALCGSDDNLHTVRFKAWHFWQKAVARIRELKALVAKAAEALGPLAGIPIETVMPDSEPVGLQVPTAPGRTVTIQLDLGHIRRAAKVHAMLTDPDPIDDPLATTALLQADKGKLLEAAKLLWREILAAADWDREADGADPRKKLALSKAYGAAHNERRKQSAANPAIWKLIEGDDAD